MINLFKELFLSYLFYTPLGDGGRMGAYAFISTSTPEGKSSLLRASTVLEEEV